MTTKIRRWVETDTGLEFLITRANADICTAIDIDGRLR